MTPEKKKDILIKQFDTKRKNGTHNSSAIEEQYADSLQEQGVKFTREFIIPEGLGMFRYDFLLDGTKTLIEVNGDNTHANPLKYKATDVIRLPIPGWKPITAEEL